MKVSIDEIKNAYNELKDKYESYLLIPEKKEKAEKFLSKLEIAYKVLGREETRNSYDKDLVKMRNDELMNNLQRNTVEYNREFEKENQERLQNEIEEKEKQKREAEERIIQEKLKQEKLNQEKLKKQKIIEENNLKQRKLKAIQESIEDQVKKQKKQFELEQKSKEILRKTIEKEYKKSVRITKFKSLFIKIISIIVLLVIVFLISQIPFIKDFYIERINYIKDLLG